MTVFTRPSIRVGGAIVIGTIASLISIYLMQLMINSPSAVAARDYDYNAVDFVRLKRESDAEVRNRKLPEKPKEKPPEKLPPQAIEKPLVKDLVMPPPTPDLKSLKNARSDGPQLSGLDLTGTYGTPTSTAATNLRPLVRTQPQYPRRAVLKGIEGEVLLGFVIDASGAVEDVRVISGSPAGVFERAATRAIRKWKFRPKLVNGKPTAYEAQQKLVFRLDRST